MEVILPVPVSATGGLDPSPDPDPPKPPATDRLPPTDAAHAITEAFTDATDLEVVGEESPMEVSPPRVQDGIGMECDAMPMRGLDPGADASQRCHHGVPAVPPHEGCTAAVLLMRALIMFTGGVGGPWSSGLGVASAKITKGLVMAAAEAIEVGLGWLPKARPDAVTAACGQLDRREALAFLVADAVLGIGLLSLEAAREVGQAAGKLVWVAKGTPRLKHQVATAKQAVQRGAAARGLTPQQLAREKADAEDAVLREPCALQLPAARLCRAVVAKEATPIAALPPPVAATTPVTAAAATATPSPATAAAAAVPPVITPPPAIAGALADAAATEPTAASPPSFAPHFTVDYAGLPDVHLPLVPWFDHSPETSTIFHDVVCRERDQMRTMNSARVGAASVGVQFYLEDVVLPDGSVACTFCAQPPPCPSDAVVVAHVANVLGHLVWLVETGRCNFY